MEGRDLETEEKIFYSFIPVHQMFVKVMTPRLRHTRRRRPE